MFAIAKLVYKEKDNDGITWRPDIQTGAKWDWTMMIKRVSETDGTPKLSWTLLWISDDSDEITGEGLLKFPKSLMTSTVQKISSGKRQQIKNKLDSLGIDTSDINLSMKLGKIIKKIGKRIDINFRRFGGIDFNKF